MAAQVRVVSPLAVVRATDGRFHHFYQGALLAGAAFDDEHVNGLVEQGMLEVVEVDAEGEPAEAATPAARRGRSAKAQD